MSGPGQTVSDAQARSEARLGALYRCTEAIRRTLLTQSHDAQRLQAHLDPLRRLGDDFVGDRNDIPDALFNYFQDVLHGVTEHLKNQIKAALDQPDRPEPPITHFLHVERTGRPGRPRIAINPEFLSNALELRPPSQIGPELFNISTRTVSRRATELALRERLPPVFETVTDDQGIRHQVRLPQPQRPPGVSDEALDEQIRGFLVLFPNSGRKSLLGLLKSIGINVTRKRVEESFHRVNGPRAEFSQRRIERRVYKVPGPNSLWHHDGNHKLIRWKVVTHAFIDGFSRLIVAIHAVNNNRADTVLVLFHKAISRYGRPSRVRGDYGVENVAVAQDQEAVNGIGRGSYIFGRSVHNIRIERLWVDVARGYVSKWADLFRDLEEYHGLDVDLDAHIWLLHFLFLDLINEDALQWAAGWNAHPMTLPQGQRSGRSPLDQFYIGTSQLGARGLDAIDEAYLEQPNHTALNLDQLDDNNLAEQVLRRGEDTIALNAPPPRWSRVNVEPPQDSYLDADQSQQLKSYVLSRLAGGTISDMAVRLQMWRHGLWYFNQILHA